MRSPPILPKCIYIYISIVTEEAFKADGKCYENVS